MQGLVNFKNSFFQISENMSSEAKVPGLPKQGDIPSSTLKVRQFSRVQKLKISAQSHPCSGVLKNLKKHLQVMYPKKISII